MDSRSGQTVRRTTAARQQPDEPSTNEVNPYSKDDYYLRAEKIYLRSRTPQFGQWIKQTWLDIVTMLVLGAVGMALYKIRPISSRYFAITYADGKVVNPEYAYPIQPVFVPIWLATVLASGVPILAMLLMQIRVRSFWDFNNGVTGVLYSLVSGATFQVLLKWLIGGIRPHFLAVCKPDMARLATQVPGGIGFSKTLGEGFTHLYYTREICTGDTREISDSLESFPSGHTTAAFAGSVFLALYLNAKLKLFADYHPAMWKLVLVYAPVLGATLIGGSLTIDGSHHWYDVVAGALLGTLMAFSSYRMVYVSIWDWRANHIPLLRRNPYPSTKTLQPEGVRWYNDSTGEDQEGGENTAADSSV